MSVCVERVFIKHHRYCCRPRPYAVRDRLFCEDLLYTLRSHLEHELHPAPFNVYSIPFLHYLSTKERQQLNSFVAILSGYSKLEDLKQGEKNGWRKQIKCRTCNSFTLYNMLYDYEGEQVCPSVEHFIPTLFHMACLLPDPAPLVAKLTQFKDHINERNIFGNVTTKSNFEAINILLENGADATVRDTSDETPLHYVKNYLRESLIEDMKEIVLLLLQKGAQPDLADKEGRTILSHSIQHLDETFVITTALLNHGATLWNDNETAFVWLLRAVMSRSKVEKCSDTLEIIGDLMSADSAMFYQHVISTMLRHSRGYTVYGPLFLQLKTKMQHFWQSPKRLTKLCRIAIRSSFKSKDFYLSVDSLPVPDAYKDYILLDNSAFGEDNLR